MSAPYTKLDYLGEPVILNRGYHLCGLLTVCERAVASLDAVGDGKYRDSVLSGLGQALELAGDIAEELRSAIEEMQPVGGMTGGDDNG